MLRDDFECTVHVYVCTRLKKIKQLVRRKILRIDPNLGFRNRIVEIVLFSLYEQINQLYVFQTVIEDLLEILDLQRIVDR